MNYPAAFQDFFKSPKWTMNLLLGGLCCLIPVVGPMVLTGWLLAGFWGRTDDRVETFPDFTFDNFGKKLERGLWPTLVSLVVGIVVAPVALIILFIGMFAAGTVGDDSGGLFAALGTLMVGCVILLLVLAVMFLTMPAVLRSALMQDFGAAFDVAFVKRFLGLTKQELAISMAFMGAAILTLVVLSFVPCVGILLSFAVAPLVNYAWTHLSKQLYLLYLSRGGEPVAISPKLSEEAPPTPPGPSIA